MTTEEKETRRRKVVRELPVLLTDTELATIARQMGAEGALRSKMEGEAKVSASQWKDRIAGVDARIADLAAKAHEGKEARPVACWEVDDYRLGEVRVERADTGEKLEVRPMRADERQPTLPVAGMDKPPSLSDAREKKKGKKGQFAEVPAPAPDPNTPQPADDPDSPPPEGAVTDPQAMLDNAAEDDGGDKPTPKTRH